MVSAPCLSYSAPVISAFYEEYFNVPLTANQVNPVDCIKIHMAGAVYCITDMIIFEIYKDIHSMDYYLNVVITQDEMTEYRTIFRWDQIPEDVMEIYDYVNHTSALEINDNSYVLYGTHIGRIHNHKYKLMTSLNEHLNTYEVIDQSFRRDTEQVTNMCKDIAENMRIVKGL